MTSLTESGATLAHHPQTERLLQLALEEDIGSGDVTTQASVPAGTTASARIEARQVGIVCGFPVIQRLIALADSSLQLDIKVDEGDEVKAGDVLAQISGDAAEILTLERTILNFLQRLSGIASITRSYVDAAGDSKVSVLETRKTIPGWRLLDKYAVLAGGGANHRMGLFDQILAKENHFALIPADDFGGKLTRLKELAAEGIRIQVEVEDLKELQAALEQNIELVLLDNMSCADMQEAVRMRDLSQATTLLEASGGITLENMGEVTATGIDRISIGALTHSVPAFDLSLLIKS